MGFKTAPRLTSAGPSLTAKRNPSPDTFHLLDRGRGRHVSGSTMVEAHEMQERIEEGAAHGGRRIALLIAALAAALAIVTTTSEEASQEAIKSNIDSSDLWSFFQAKSIRQTVLQTEIDALQLQLDTFPADRRPAAEDKIKSWEATVRRYESEPSTKEGRKELSDRATKAEHLRDEAIAAHKTLDFSVAALQLAIVLASASAIFGVVWLVWLAAGLGGIGVVLAALGWTAPTLLGG
jgi:hypothetical protein